MSGEAGMGREKRGIITIQEKCPYVEKCGACHMGQTTYEEELAAKKELVKSFKIWIYNEDTGRGILRHVLVRKGMSTKQVMVVLALPVRSSHIRIILWQNEEKDILRLQRLSGILMKPIHIFI